MKYSLSILSGVLFCVVSVCPVATYAEESVEALNAQLASVQTQISSIDNRILKLRAEEEAAKNAPKVEDVLKTDMSGVSEKPLSAVKTVPTTLPEKTKPVASKKSVELTSERPVLVEKVAQPLKESAPLRSAVVSVKEEIAPKSVSESPKSEIITPLVSEKAERKENAKVVEPEEAYSSTYSVLSEVIQSYVPKADVMQKKVLVRVFPEITHLRITLDQAFLDGKIAVEAYREASFSVNDMEEFVHTLISEMKDVDYKTMPSVSQRLEEKVSSVRANIAGARTKKIGRALDACQKLMRSAVFVDENEDLSKNTF
jgi:hypothetical protein